MSMSKSLSNIYLHFAHISLSSFFIDDIHCSVHLGVHLEVHVKVSHGHFGDGTILAIFYYVGLTVTVWGVWEIVYKINILCATHTHFRETSC